MKFIVNKIKNRIKFKKEFSAFRQLAKGHKQRFDLSPSDIYICMNDKTPTTGFDRHYVYHTAWAVRYLKSRGTTHHIDIASTLFFCGMASAFLDVDFYDYRPADLELSGLKSKKGDLNNLPWEDNSINSLSCMHTVEHVGLGRYGDPFDYDGDLKAIQELSRVMAPNGDLLFVVPLGNKARIQYNAHRIYTKEQIISYFDQHGMSLRHFTLIPESGEDGGLIENPTDELLNRQRYGCGCFVFSKS